MGGFPAAAAFACCVALPALAQDWPGGTAASSVYSSGFIAEFAFDGSTGTRWASAPATGVEWVGLDFGEERDILSLRIVWEAAYARAFSVQASRDGRAWEVLRAEDTADGGVSLLQGLEGRGRYLRVVCSEPSRFGLYSIWEVEPADPVTAEAFAAHRRRAEAERERQRAVTRSQLLREGVERIVYAVRHPSTDGHWYANFGYYAADPNHRPFVEGGGSLCVLEVATGEVRVLLEDSAGSVRDPQVHYDGERVVFSYRPAGSAHYNLYEMSMEGRGLRQLTHGPWDDIEPTYLADGGIIFCSSRAMRWVNCWLTPVAVLYRCDSDGSNLRPISANVEHDNTPWPLPDGRILYMRWEYVDRSQVDYHHLWTANPDGTNQTVFYGNQAPGIVMLDAKPMPNGREVVAVFSPGHGLVEHQGAVVIVDPNRGPDDPTAVRVLAARQDLRDPYPLESGAVIVAREGNLDVLDSGGNLLAAHALPPEDLARGLWLHEPRPVRARPREHVIAPRIRLGESTGTLVLVDVYRGRNMVGVQPGDISKLLVLESLPKPINYTGGMDPLSYGGTFTLERVLGTVPVEADGSAYFELPALRSFFFVALDEQDQSVKRMQSFLSVQPGELLSCIGCHEERTEAVPPLDLLATRRPPSQIEALEGMPDVFDFPRDIQPILDRNCLPCHGYEATDRGGPRSGGVILTGDRGPMFSHAYYMLTVRGQIADGRNEAVSNRAPRTIGAVASPLMHKLLTGHNGVQPSPLEISTVRWWIESGAPYPGTYGALGGGSIGGYYANELVETDFAWTETQRAAEAIARRCDSCHQGAALLPRALSDERDVSFWRPDWSDARLRLARHIVFNLSRPHKSLILLAPLASSAGGYGTCQPGPVFASQEDHDYQAILAMIERGKSRLEEIGRFDMPHYRPPTPYLREMVRYGVLGEIPAEGLPVDTYDLDRRYWRSLWWDPQ